MADSGSFQFDAEKLERSFSSLQRVDDSVQTTESTMPGCCSRTTLTLRCRPAQRDYSLVLPLKSRRPNETPDAPPQNRRQHVMTAQVPCPVLQILSVKEGNEVAEVVVSAEGPAACPPGMPNRVKVDGVGGGMQDAPFPQWMWKAPAILDAQLMEPLNEDMIALLHPFKAAGLPAQVWTVSLPGCPASKIKASVAAFPDVRWQGQLTVAAHAAPGSESGFEIQQEGDLTCRYNGRDFPIQTRVQARSLCRWFDCLEVLARSAQALQALIPKSKYDGFDNPRLEKHGAFQLAPWPRLTVALESALFEQSGNGLLGHALKILISGDPLMGAEGEISLLPVWLEDSMKRRLLAPLTAAMDVTRVEEITQELGLWLVAEGAVSLRAGVEARQPVAQTHAIGRASGQLRLRVEARSLREYDGSLIRSGGAEDGGLAAGLNVVCEAPVDSPLPEPREKKCRVAVAFSGCAVHSIEKIRPGCRFRPWLPPEEKMAGPTLLVPARSWPGGASPSEPAEVPWCD